MNQRPVCLVAGLFQTFGQLCQFQRSDLAGSAFECVDFNGVIFPVCQFLQLLDARSFFGNDLIIIPQNIPEQFFTAQQL